MKNTKTVQTRFALVAGLLCILIGTSAITFHSAASADTSSNNADTPKIAPATMTFNETNNGQTALATLGDTFEVKLESNASTGYQWSVAKQDTEALEAEGEPKYVRPAHSLPGSPGQQVFRFKIKQVGETKLELHYTRPWEKDKEPAQIFIITLSVSKAK